MPYLLHELIEDGEHRWAVAACTCKVEEDEDPLLQSTVELVREAYGESELLAGADPDFLAKVDPSVAVTFDLEAIKKGFRMGLPDPAEEAKTKKPLSLRNYRSEAAEMVARGALRVAHGVEYYSHPQKGKVNSNQPFLGFDGWGLIGAPDVGWTLVLIQVKATDEPKCPPKEAHTLASECMAVPTDRGKLCRAIAVLANNLKGTEQGIALLLMLEQLGKGELPPMALAPVIVRGVTHAHFGDLEPIRAATPHFAPAVARGVTVSINVELIRFGERVMSLARAA